MNAWQALIFGVVQGITEFLPVSSSGHLALFQQWFSIQEPTLFFNVFLHAASLIAIVLFFWSEIISLKIREYWLLAVGSIPIAIVGLLFESSVEFVAGTTLFVGLALVITGIINAASQKKLDALANQSPPKKSPVLRFQQVLIIGLFQSLAIIPGISRSGTTLLGGLSQKLDRKKAFTFTFLLGIPAILGANLLQITKLISGPPTTVEITPLVIGGLGALVTSLASLSLLQRVIEQARLRIFSWYCLVLGSGIIAAQLIL